MASIEFSDISLIDNRRIESNCIISDGTTQNHFRLWFEFSRPVFVTNDAIGLAFSTLCGRAYSEITYSIALPRQTQEEVSAFTLAKVKSETSHDRVSVPRAGMALSFSGGFDSLAALSLMPDNTRLISMDFGGRFNRERAFFESFDTTIISTNLLETPLSKNSWSFMGIGAILTNQHYRSEYHTFGSILEAGADNLRPFPIAAENVTFPPFQAAGFTNAPYVAGLTEVGTLMVLQHYKPELISPSLTSLASPGEEKLYRKSVLAEIVSERTGRDFNLPEVRKPASPHFKFGQNFALDFLSFYVAKFSGGDVLGDMVADVPTDLVRIARGLDLTLFERANTTLYRRFPSALFGGLAGRLAGASIPFYTENDWHEYQEIRAFLAAYHPVLKTS